MRKKAKAPRRVFEQETDITRDERMNTWFKFGAFVCGAEGDRL